VLRALPAGSVPALDGYQLAGTFTLELGAAIDWAALAGSTLVGGGGLDRCQVARAPALSPTMLTAPFTVRREVGESEVRDIVLSPRRPDHVRLAAVPPHVIASLIATEDPRFDHHDGVDFAALGRALVANLAAGTFRAGSSTITMQLARNVFLHRNKTLSRKLQEVVLAWHTEQVLSKPKILELYLNLIELGPGVYGVGAAARHYFGKHASALDPREAAFLSAIAPRPTVAYQSFCNGRLDDLTAAKVRRALSLMVYAGKITTDQWQEASDARLVFRPGRESGSECMARRERAFALLRQQRSGGRW
jgi:membrane peptidoglycan carboxypeptidase